MQRRKTEKSRISVKANPEYLRLHLEEPDYSREPLDVPRDIYKKIKTILSKLYGSAMASRWYPEIKRKMQVYYAHKTEEMIEDDSKYQPENRFTEKDMILITYGDLIASPGKRPLEVLYDVLTKNVPFATTVHILPFFPYSSDRGFSVKSYFAVDPRMGVWADIDKLGTRYELMFDGVINHVSSKSRLFQEFLNGNPEFEDFFIRFSTDHEMSPDHRKLILRPRTSDVLTKYNTLYGPKFVWTTFSEDQIDLNYKNIKVLLYVLDVLFFYVRKGADIIRLDAVTYLWSELGTSCAHLEQTHLVIQLFRLILDAVAPKVALITETNVPHEDNISYFGDGSNEAQMIYNFTLPPLVLYSLYSGSARKLSQWADSLRHVSDTATYFNFLDSHDGIGLLPVKSILDDQEIQTMIDRVIQHGGMVSYRTEKDGSQSAYELNITWFSALNKENSNEKVDLQIDRFVASRAIALVMKGVPGIYMSSLIGTRNDFDSVTKTGEKRSINRKTFHAEALQALLEDRNSTAYRLMLRLGILFNVRFLCSAFHPNASMKVLLDNEAVFAVVRQSVDKTKEVVCLTNISDEKQIFTLRKGDVDNWPAAFVNMFTSIKAPVSEAVCSITLNPYQVKWFEALKEEQD